MIKLILKLAFLTILILIGLKIFAPEIYNETSEKISETTGIDKNTLDNKIQEAQDLAKQGASKLKESAKDIYEEAKEKIE